MTSVLKVLTHPSPRLRKPTQPVDASTLVQLRRDGFLDALVATMRAEDGVGIAAIQVGAPHRIFVAQEGHTTRIYVNPEITTRSLRTDIDTEGCLSVPGVLGSVRRARSVTMRALDPDGNPVERRVRGLVARIYQHEIDHLDGILFIDRAIQVFALASAPHTPRV